MNKGLHQPTVKSPGKGKKCKSTAELTLCEPSSDRIAGQEQITTGKQQQSTRKVETHTDTVIIEQILGIAIKTEEVKQEKVKEDKAYAEILGACKTRCTTAPKLTKHDSAQSPDVELTNQVLYAHAH